MITGLTATACFSDLFEYYRPLMRILCCPHTGGELRLVAAADLSEGLLRGHTHGVPGDLCAVFISEKAKIAYPVFGMICSFLAEHEIPMSSGDFKYSDSNGHAVKNSVRHYYDSHGWQKNTEGLYHDTAANAAEQGPYRTYEMETNLGLLERWEGGEFILDAASGAIAVTEYRAYSWFFQYRVCVDLSYVALEQASRKLGTSGYYVLSDICRMPFSDNVFAGVISGYTIQHIPRDQQQSAVGQIYRVLGPGKTACIVTAYSGHPIRDMWLRVWHLFRKPLVAVGGNHEAAPQLYMATQPLRWWRGVGKKLGANLSITSFRLLGKREFELLCRNSYRVMRLMRSAEMVCPKLLAPLAAIVCIGIVKPQSRKTPTGY